MRICQTCAVEHPDGAELCAICADERQWVPADGQQWTSLAALAARGATVRIQEREPDLFDLTSEPAVGIGQHAHLVRTPAGCVLWDPIGYVDDDAARRIRALGDVIAVAASHPHMFGVQVQWSRALGGVPVLVAEPNLPFLARRDDVVTPWRGRRRLAPTLELVQIGGHFPGSAVLHWSAGAGGRGVLLSSDSIQANPDLATVTFMRSFPNRIPLSAAVVERLVGSVGELAFDRLYDNFGRAIRGDAPAALRRSADRYIGWIRGDFDHLT